MKNKLKTKLQINENTKIKNIINYPNLKTLVFSEIFNDDFDYNVELNLVQNSKIDTIILNDDIKIKNDKNYVLTHMEIAFGYITITYKSQYDMITRSYTLDKKNKSIELYREETTLIEFKDEWNNNGIITIPPYDNVSSIDLSKYELNKNTTLDLRNVKNICSMRICDEINNMIVKSNQILDIYCYYNNDLTLNIESDKINRLEDENLILKFNDNNKKRFVRINNSRDKHMKIEYGDIVDFEAYRNNWSKRITIDNNLTITDNGYVWDNKNGKITSDEFNQERKTEKTFNLGYRYANCKEEVNTLMKVFKRNPGRFYEK